MFVFSLIYSKMSMKLPECDLRMASMFLMRYQPNLPDSHRKEKLLVWVLMGCQRGWIFHHPHGRS